MLSECRQRSIRHACRSLYLNNRKRHQNTPWKINVLERGDEFTIFGKLFTTHADVEKTFFYRNGRCSTFSSFLCYCVSLPRKRHTIYHLVKTKEGVTLFLSKEKSECGLLRLYRAERIPYNLSGNIAEDYASLLHEHLPWRKSSTRSYLWCNKV